MHIFETVAALREQVNQWKKTGLTIGFVPTMGNLHAGHLSLVKLAQQQCDKVVVSVFVNPMQFGPNEDFERYPRTFDADCAQLEKMVTHGVFVPSVEEMYPNGVEQTVVAVPEVLTGLLEGATRPGHFDGVSTVVCKLFNMVQPDVAVFGQKDFQQLRVIEQMVRDLALPVKIVAAPIARDADGLALSSRNQYLSTAEREIAPQLYQTLQRLQQQLTATPDAVASLCQSATESLLAVGFNSVDYIQVCDTDSLSPLQKITSSYVILAVARLGNTRLLDNIFISE